MKKLTKDQRLHWRKAINNDHQRESAHLRKALDDVERIAKRMAHLKSKLVCPHPDDCLTWTAEIPTCNICGSCPINHAFTWEGEDDG